MMLAGTSAKHSAHLWFPLRTETACSYHGSQPLPNLRLYSSLLKMPAFWLRINTLSLHDLFPYITRTSTWISLQTIYKRTKVFNTSWEAQHSIEFPWGRDASCFLTECLADLPSHTFLCLSEYYMKPVCAWPSGTLVTSWDFNIRPIYAKDVL